MTAGGARAKFVCVIALLLPAVLVAQQSPAAAYLERYREIVNLKPLAGQVAEVKDLVLRREAGELTLARGVLYLLSPVGGRTVGAAFRGQGRFRFTPSVAAERARLQAFAGAPVLDDSTTEVILLFADSTLDQLRGLTFGTGEIPAEVQAHVRDLIASLEGKSEGSFSSSVMGPLLNGETNGLFVARVDRPRGGAVLFQVDPALSEGVGLYRPVSRSRWGTSWAPITRLPPEAGAPPSWVYRHRLGVPRYVMDVRLTPTAMGDLSFAASAALTLRADEPTGPWFLFDLHRDMVVDSAQWGSGASGTPAVLFKAKESDDLWVRADSRLQAGDSLELTVFYHGDLIDRFGDWFFINPTASWYPVNGQGTNLAHFEITYHSPSWYPLASIGNRVDSLVDGRVLTTRWVTELPTPFASFNLGVFDHHRVQHEGEPPLDILISEDAHRELARDALRRGVVIPQQRKMRENVAADVSNSLKLFTAMYGEPPYKHFFVTEIPYGHGVSFPGLIHMSWGTFQNTSLDGFDEFFRAHEVAHQWWGNGVRPASYRDAWLSEGLATFAGLRYVQTVRKRNDAYFKFLDQYRANLADYRKDGGPIWIGYRNATPETPFAYQVLIYEKGAWVFHMLRTMMLDLQTRKEDRFAETMRDFYQSYRGRTATTDDFQKVVERHAGIPMDWFFDQWVRGTDVPTYRVAWTGEAAAGGRYTVRLRVKQENVPADFRMPVLVSADLGENRFANFRITVHGGQTEYTSPLLPAPPKKLVFNELQSVLADVKMERW